MKHLTKISVAKAQDAQQTLQEKIQSIIDQIVQGVVDQIRATFNGGSGSED